ncbi:MAG: hypothetical protein LBB10_01520, partial [Bifidobacteriaceae bacterium]|nr:hypothetical protein [Bifidobacteriaceae bacterium]
MILSNDFFECLDDIFQWWESDLIEYDKQKQNKIISEIKKCQMELFGIDGRGGLTANWMKESDEIKVARKVKLSNAADFEEFRQRELNCILMHENIQSKVFILERWEDLYTVSIIKKANEEKQQLLKTKTLLKFSDELIGNLVREKFTASSESRQHRIGGTRALDAAGTPSVWRKLYKEMINPDEIKKGYNIFNWYIENTSWVKTDKEKHYREVLKKVKLSNISDFFGDLGRGNAWETVIINKLAKKHPGKISIAPYNYIYNKNEKLVARFDALKLGPSGEVEEIIEIKNTNKIEVFLPLEDLQTETSQKSLSPALAVPKRYAHQLLFYMKMANVVRGKIVALVNIFDLTKSDNVLNIKEYTISVDDEVVNFVPHIN